MVIRRSLLIAAALTLGGAIYAGAEPLQMGAAAPMADTKMKNVDGRELSISDIKGEKGTLVIFSCNHCPYVVAWEDRMAAIGKAYGEKGFGVIAVNSNDTEKYPADSLEKMIERAGKKGFQFPYVVDATSDVARAFGATRTPEVFLFDGDGKLVYHGAIDDNSKDAATVEAHYLKDALDAVVSGKPVPTPTTKALGCTIKFRPKS